VIVELPGVSKENIKVKVYDSKGNLVLIVFYGINYQGQLY